MLSTKIAFCISVASELSGLELSFLTFTDQSFIVEVALISSILKPKVCAYLPLTFPVNPVLNICLVW